MSFVLPTTFEDDSRANFPECDLRLRCVRWPIEWPRDRTSNDVDRRNWPVFVPVRRVNVAERHRKVFSPPITSSSSPHIQRETRFVSSEETSSATSSRLQPAHSDIQNASYYNDYLCLNLYWSDDKTFVVGKAKNVFEWKWQLFDGNERRKVFDLTDREQRRKCSYFFILRSVVVLISFSLAKWRSRKRRPSASTGSFISLHVQAAINRYLHSFNHLLTHCVATKNDRRNSNGAFEWGGHVQHFSTSRKIKWFIDRHFGFFLRRAERKSFR